MTELIPVLDEFSDYGPPRPGKSTILFQLIDEATYMFTRWDKQLQRCVEVGLMIDEIYYEGGSAEIAAEHGILDYAIYKILDEEWWYPGWFVMEGFYGRYTRGDDWYTDDDVNYEYDLVRPARWADMEHFGVMKAP